MNCIHFEGYAVPSDFISDGCTYAPDKLFGINLKPACKLHDFLRRHAIESVRGSDAIFRRHIAYLGAPKIIATLYWFGVKIMRPWFKRTILLPTKWNEYK